MSYVSVSIPGHRQPTNNLYRLDVSATISLGHLYTRKAFQPTDDELNPNDQGMDEELNFDWEMRGSSRRKRDDGDDLRRFIGGPFVTSSKTFPSHNWLVDDDEGSEEEGPQSSKPKKYIDSSDEEDDMVILSGSDSDTQEFSMISFTRAGMEQAAARARAKGKAKASANVPIKQAWAKSSPLKRKDGRDVQDVLRPRPQPKMLERFIPSTKMKWTMNQLKELQKTHPSDKVSVIRPP
jgi:hypothetical protein